MGFLVPVAGAAGAAAGGSTLMTVISGISTVMGFIGKIQAGQAAASADRYNAQIAANNATIARQRATLAGQEGEVNAAREEQKTKAKIGGILANQGASGVDVNSGSSVDTRASEAMVGAQDAINIRANAARTAYGYETEAMNATAQSNLDKSRAKSDAMAGYISAGSTVLSDVANPQGPFANYMSSKSLTYSDDPLDSTGGMVNY